MSVPILTARAGVPILTGRAVVKSFGGKSWFGGADTSKRAVDTIAPAIVLRIGVVRIEQHGGVEGVLARRIIHLGADHGRHAEAAANPGQSTRNTGDL